MITYRAFSIKYYGPTNTKGSRIRIRDEWKRHSVFLSRNTELSTEDQATTFLENLGIKIIANTYCDKKHVLLTENTRINLIGNVK